MLQRVSILQSEGYRMGGVLRPCLEESGLPLLLISAMIFAMIFVFFRHRINYRVMFILSLLAVATNAIAILFTDSFAWLQDWWLREIGGWHLYFVFGFASLAMVLLAFLFSQNHKQSKSDDKINSVGWAILIIASMTPYVFRAIQGDFFSNPYPNPILALLVILILFFLFGGRRFTANGRIMFYEFGFLILAASTYVIRAFFYCDLI